MTTLTLYSVPQAKTALSSAWASIKNQLADGKRLTVKVEEERRSSLQNRLLWAALSDLSEQVNWYGEKLTPEEWKHVTSAAMKKPK